MVRALTFSFDEERIGIRLDHVHEVVRVSGEVRPLGGAPPAIRGLLDVRGRVVTLLDTPVLLGCPSKKGAFSRFVAVLHEPGRSVGLLLPEKLEILELEDGIIEDDRGMEPFVEAVLEGAAEEEETELNRVALLDPAVILATCRDEVRSRFLNRVTS